MSCINENADHHSSDRERMEKTEFCLNMSKLSLPLHFHPSARGSSRHQSCQSESQGSTICVRSFCLLFVEWACMTQPDGPASSPC